MVSVKRTGCPEFFPPLFLRCGCSPLCVRCASKMMMPPGLHAYARWGAGTASRLLLPFCEALHLCPSVWPMSPHVLGLFDSDRHWKDRSLPRSTLVAANVSQNTWKREREAAMQVHSRSCALRWPDRLYLTERAKLRAPES